MGKDFGCTPMNQRSYNTFLSVGTNAKGAGPIAHINSLGLMLSGAMISNAFSRWSSCRKAMLHRSIINLQMRSYRGDWKSEKASSDVGACGTE